MHFQVIEHNLFQRLALRRVDELVQFVLQLAGQLIHTRLGQVWNRLRA